MGNESNKISNVQVHKEWEVLISTDVAPREYETMRRLGVNENMLLRDIITLVKVKVKYTPRHKVWFFLLWRHFYVPQRRILKFVGHQGPGGQ